MLILAIDTSGRHGSVALCRGDASSFELLQLTPLDGGTYSARLIPTIDEMLKANHLKPADLDGFAVVSGPGSFTGLRVGLATVKGLCEILRKPLVTVSMLEALTITYGSAGQKITAILDAGRAEVYGGDYEIAADRATPLHEYIVKLSEFAPTAAELITPDAAVANHFNDKGVVVRVVAPVQADGIARIGLRKLLAGDVADHATVDVNYIRRSDAEIFSAPKP
jgi:tRNA threonylcarbamoyladenosine biosynthesis protein TsaB